MKRTMRRNGSVWHVGRGLPASTRRYRYLRRVDYCSGSSLLLRRDAWDAAGGFDEGFFPGYYEDVAPAMLRHIARARVPGVAQGEPGNALAGRDDGTVGGIGIRIVYRDAGNIVQAQAAG